MEPDYFEEGREAYLGGQPLSACPAGLTPGQQADWMDGYKLAMEEDDE